MGACTRRVAATNKLFSRCRQLSTLETELSAENAIQSMASESRCSSLALDWTGGFVLTALCRREESAELRRLVQELTGSAPAKVH